MEYKENEILSSSDEYIYEVDFAGDLYDFECLWTEYGAEVQRHNETMELEQRFAKQLTITVRRDDSFAGLSTKEI
ncbi:unnamed protein product [Ceratitis capitata]|uniref:(Mediterranean fruit fly) hypothetical protein n=1 Tax=Ceratitis capitata TaxID=7213 RepID=A0A811VJ34_CERCA|nr:unnamed protein product [Ceratitis capitata]